MTRSLGILTAIAALLWPGVSWAHNLLAQGQVEADKIIVEAFYDDETPAKAALVKVFQGDKLLLEDKTDAQGFCCLPRPEAGDYHILVNAGAGHRTKFDLHVTAKLPVREAVPPTTASDVGTVASAGPSRAESTRYPWLKIGVGLSAIGLFALMFWAARRQRAATRQAV